MMTVTFLAHEISRAEKQDQSHGQARGKDHHEVQQHQTGASAHRLAWIHRVQSVQLGQETTEFHHQLKSFRSGTTVSSSGPASMLTFNRCMR